MSTTGAGGMTAKDRAAASSGVAGGISNLNLGLADHRNGVTNSEYARGTDLAPMGSGMTRPDHGGSTVESRLSALAAKES